VVVESLDGNDEELESSHSEIITARMISARHPIAAGELFFRDGVEPDGIGLG
jgi:hypothetical protein